MSQETEAIIASLRAAGLTAMPATPTPSEHHLRIRQVEALERIAMSLAKIAAQVGQGEQTGLEGRVA
ncbi:hypothetical protein [Falsiroseomonas tokyonensis]|uniref:Uncharacterized protein n=1 Tax=Falsiroseomonas tokyonensis TaxID=430521 RepID=A0ABV7BZJ2_9PROT|nr:hypothetical protein [Falsiroseomonas tokyonensis]MBU8540828.1 hypothetical protein [Falsiroseomonas tokyonensis]